MKYSEESQDVWAGCYAVRKEEGKGSEECLCGSWAQQKQFL